MDVSELTAEVEAVSRIYATRHQIHRDDAWFLLKLQEEVGELTQSYLMRAGQARDKGHTEAEIEADFRAELADVFAQTMVMARHFGVDLQTEIERKWLVRNPAWQQRSGQA